MVVLYLALSFPKYTLRGPTAKYSVTIISWKKKKTVIAIAYVHYVLA